MKYIDWEQRRYEIAKDLLPSILKEQGASKISYAISLSVNCADILIRRLKQGMR